MADKDETRAEVPADKADAAATRTSSASNLAPSVAEAPAGAPLTAISPPAAKAPEPAPSRKVKAPAKRKPAAPSEPAAQGAGKADAPQRKRASVAAGAKAGVARPAAPAKAARTATPSPAPRRKAEPVAAAKAAPRNSDPVLHKNPTQKEQKMEKSFAGGFQDMIGDAQAKARDAFEKSADLFGECGDFAKGNVEAAIESGKILATGIQSIGNEALAESKTAFATISQDMKDLATVKSPTDFIKVQGDIALKNIDTVVAYSAKNSEAMIKLATDMMAPLTGRVSLAFEKVRKAAA